MFPCTDRRSLLDLDLDLDLWILPALGFCLALLLESRNGSSKRLVNAGLANTGLSGLLSFLRLQAPSPVVNTHGHTAQGTVRTLRTLNTRLLDDP
jgi:hypothetical protein